METKTFFELLGTTGSLIMCASSLPQIWKTYRTKCITGLSGTYLAVLMIGMTLILLYALSVKDVVFIFGNGVSLTLTAILIGMRHQYGKNRGGIKWHQKDNECPKTFRKRDIDNKYKELEQPPQALNTDGKTI